MTPSYRTSDTAIVLLAVVAVLLTIDTAHAEDWQQEFLVPQYHQFHNRLWRAAAGGGGIPTVHYCGSTLKGNLVLATNVALCHGRMRVGPARAVRIAQPAAGDKFHKKLQARIRKRAGLNAYVVDRDRLWRQIDNIYNRGYGIMSKVYARDLLILAPGQLHPNRGANAIRNLQPGQGVCAAGGAGPNAACLQIFGPQQAIPVPDSRQKQTANMKRLNDVIRATRVQGVPLNTYFGGMAAGGDKIGVVGGAVRDTLVGSPIADVDIAVSKFLPGITESLTATWTAAQVAGNAVPPIPMDLEIHDVLKLEGIRKMFGMALLDKTGNEAEGLDVGTLKIKRPMPFYRAVNVNYMTWEPKIKMQPDGKVNIRATLGPVEALAFTQAANGVKAAYAAAAQAHRGRPLQPPDGEKDKNTFTRVGEFRDLPSNKIFPLAAHAREDYAFEACLKFIRNYMGDKFVTHLALKYNPDYASYECFMTPDVVDLNVLGGVLAARAAGANANPVERSFDLYVRVVDDWGFGIASSDFPPSFKDKSRPGFTGAEDEDQDEGTNQYLYGYSFYEDAKQRDYTVNAVYAVWSDNYRHGWFADPLRPAGPAPSGGYFDLKKVTRCTVRPAGAPAGPGLFPRCGPGNLDRTKCCHETVNKKPGRAANGHGFRHAPFTKIANEEAYEQDLGGQFRFFKMLKKGYSFVPGGILVQNSRQNLVAKVCRFMLLRLSEVVSAMDEKITLLFFKRMWKKLFDETEDFAAVQARLEPIWTEMENNNNKEHCWRTWNTIVKNAGVVLYGVNHSVHKLTTAIIDDHRGKGYIDSAISIATAFTPTKVHYATEHDVPDSHARHLAGHILARAISNGSLHAMQRDTSPLHAFESWLGTK